MNRSGLRHSLRRLDPEDVGAADPAGVFPRFDAAPAALALVELADHPGFGAGDDGGVWRRSHPERADPAGDDGLAVRPQHLFVDPADRAFPVADLAPMLDRAQHLDRHVAPVIFPFDRILLPRPAAHM